jgi:hypothetical protein
LCKSYPMTTGEPRYRLAGLRMQVLS